MNLERLCCCQLNVRQGSRTGAKVGPLRSAAYELTVEVNGAVAGDYFAELRNMASGSRTFTWLAGGDLRKA